MKIIVGLGNPGGKYLQSRHNVGYQIVDLIKEKLEFPDFAEKPKFKSLISEGTCGDEKLILLKPLTFMNLSGEAVKKAAGYYKVGMHDIWVIYDDLDFETGKFKIRAKGGAGTHNGIRSIVTETGSDEFKRWKIGIESRTDEGKLKIPSRSFVLAKFLEKENEIMNEVREKAAESVIFALKNDIKTAMNKYN